MEIGQKEIHINFEQPVVISGGALQFVLYRCKDSLVFGSMVHEGEGVVRPEQAALNYCRETELLLTGEGRNFAARSRSLGGCGERLSFVKSHHETRNGGQLISLEYIRDDLKLRVFSRYFFCDETIPVVRRWVDVVNEGHTPVGMEQLSSVALYHLHCDGSPNWMENTRLRIPYSGWCGEAQWQTLTCAQAGITSLDSSHYRATCVGSRSSAEKNPMAILEDVQTGLSTFWQIEHSSSWMWELGRLMIRDADHSFYLVAGGPNDEVGNWWKQLRPGQCFSSVPVAVGRVRGGFDEAIAALTHYRRKACKRPHPQDDKLPVIFNDYMNCLDGNPTLEKELPLIKAAADVGCEYYVMDSGYYAAPGEHWWPNVGHWLPNRQRFPDDTFKAFFDQVRSHGMTPGLWIEGEVVGVNNELSAKPDDWFLARHGKRIIYNGRYFLNFSNPQVQEHMHNVIDRFVNEYGVGYIKNDYNIDLLQGTDSDADSMGDGLLEHTRAFYRWLEQVHQRHPDLIIENCGAGGLRTDYGILSRTQLQSSSDMPDYAMYAALSIGCSATCLPEQMAIWAYPITADDKEETIFNMVNALMMRIHLSGPLAGLNRECTSLVSEAIDYYKKHRELIKESIPLYPLGCPSALSDKLWLVLGMKTKQVTRLAVWRRNAQSNEIRVDLKGLPSITRVECAYPEVDTYKPEMSVKGSVLTIKSKLPAFARIVHLYHS